MAAGDDASLYKALLRRDRAIGFGALLSFTALAWWYLLSGAGMDMAAMPATGMVAPVAWTPGYAAIVFAMWWVMMVAMMLPSALPMILLYGLVSHHRTNRGAATIPNGIFALGYLTVWGAFSLIATAIQWQLERLALMSPMMTTSSTLLGAALLIGAGAYQLTPLKDSCLRHCRGPVEFLSRHWRPGAAGAWAMGLEHGLYCLGCCWVLMTLLFYGGVMNLYWIIGLTLYVMLEKFTSTGAWFNRVSGTALIAWGAVVLSAGL